MDDNGHVINRMLIEKRDLEEIANGIRRRFVAYDRALERKEDMAQFPLLMSIFDSVFSQRADDSRNGGLGQLWVIQTPYWEEKVCRHADRRIHSAGPLIMDLDSDTSIVWLLAIQRWGHGHGAGMCELIKGRVTEQSNGDPITTCRKEAREEGGVLNRLDVLDTVLAVEHHDTTARSTGVTTQKVVEYFAAWPHGLEKGHRIQANLNYAEANTIALVWVNIATLNDH